MSERRPPPPPECAQCGATIPPRALACPECGADERTGWRETSIYDGMDLPESAWSDDADENTSAKSGSAGRIRDVNGIRWYWWCAGVALLFILVLGTLALLEGYGVRRARRRYGRAGLTACPTLLITRRAA